MIPFIWRFEPCLFTLEPNISGGLKCLGVMEGPRFQDDVILFYIQRFVKDSDPTIATKETFHLSSAVGGLGSSNRMSAMKETQTTAIVLTFAQRLGKCFLHDPNLVSKP